MKKGQLACLIAAIVLCTFGIFGYVKCRLDRQETSNKTENKDNGQNTTVSEGTFVWKMKVINKDGAKVYDGALENASYDLNKEMTLGNIITTLQQDTVIDIVGDGFYNGFNLEIKFDNFNKIKDSYYLRYKCSNTNEFGEANSCYVKYNDVELGEFANVPDKEHKFQSTKKALLTNNVDIFEGPALMFNKKKANVSADVIIDVDYNYNENDWIYINYNGITGWAYESRYRDIDYHYTSLLDFNGIKLGKELYNATITTRKVAKLYDEKGNIMDEIPANTTLKHDVYLYQVYGVFYNSKHGYIKVTSDDKVCNVEYDENENCDFEITGGYVGV